jgi:hypothetical protein
MDRFARWEGLERGAFLEIETIGGIETIGVIVAIAVIVVIGLFFLLNTHCEWVLFLIIFDKKNRCLCGICYLLFVI